MTHAPETPTTGLEALRAILYAQPSPHTWDALCQVFAHWPSQHPADIATLYALEHLQHWPDTLRLMPRSMLHSLLGALNAGTQPDTNPLWSLIRCANMSRCRIGTPMAQALSRCPQLEPITHLDLSHNLLKPEGLAALARSALMAAVRNLNLHDNHLGVDGARALDGALPQLQTLNLSHTRLGDAGLKAILQGQPCEDLQTLNLGNNQLSTSAAVQLARWRRLAPLRSLSLHMNTLGDEGVSTFVGRGGLEGLWDLDLSHNGLEYTGLMALVQHPHALTLRALALRGSRLGESIIQALPGSPLLQHLEALELNNSQLGDTGLEALCAHADLSSLHALSLRSTGLGSRGAQALATCALPRLHTLDLSYNSALTGGVSAFEGAARLGALETLNLKASGINNRALAALARSPATHQLQHLDLSNNRVGARGLQTLLGAAAMATLQTLKLASNPLEDDGALVLGKGQAPALETLDLSRTRIKYAGLEAICNGELLRNVHTLHLGQIELDDRGAQLLSRTQLPNLTALDLSQNNIGPEGLKALLDAPWAHSLKDLNLRQNPIGDAGADAMAMTPALAGLERLSMGVNNTSTAGLRALASAPHHPEFIRARFKP